MTLTDDELRHAISAGFSAILDGVSRVRHRRARIAALGAPLSVRQSRNDRRRAARERSHRPVRQQPPLTPYALRMDMAKSGNVQLTELGRMVSDEEARALEEWALCEEMLSGRLKSASWDLGRGGGGQSASIPDAWMAQLSAHACRRSRLSADSLKILMAFTALQNGSEGALSAAQYGERFFPGARNKRRAFLEAVAGVAGQLV
ncbi:MAG TPA: hypothetical protein VK652_01055 [Steroidobacteraceae bacterium]|nr:hypothetical protein [Steroidobacteraceae bacterium]